MPVTFHAEIEPNTPVKEEVEVASPPPPSPTSPPPIERQCAFTQTAQCGQLETDWLEIGVIAGCIVSVAIAGYTLGYRHALENTLSNLLSDTL